MRDPDVIILVEDNPSDVILVEEALKIYNLTVKLVVLEDGDSAVRWIEDNDKVKKHVSPAAVVLDLNLPKRGGAEVLDQLRASHSLQRTPVIIFTSSNSYRDRALRDRYPLTTYFRKSADFDEFVQIGEVLKQMIEGRRATDCG